MGRLGVGVDEPIERLPLYMLSVSVLGVVLISAEIVVFALYDPAMLADSQYLSGILTSLPFLVAAAWGTRWLRSAEVSSERYPRILRWAGVGTVLSLGINALFIALMSSGQTGELVRWVRFAVIFGGTIGLFVGLAEARAIERAVRAERTLVRQRQLEQQQELLAYLNAVLRHEVLNTASIIGGYATQLQDATDPESQKHEWAAIVEEEAEETSRVVEDVRVLVQTLTGDHQLTTVDLAAVVRNETGKLENRHEDVELSVDLPRSVPVYADQQLARVVWNLLSNAVEHNDSATPSVSVVVGVDDDCVRLEVVDDGPGIPEEERDTLFERTESWGGAHGMGLYLSAQLVDRYGGSIEVAESGPDGSRFTVELPLATSGTEPPDVVGFDAGDGGPAARRGDAAESTGAGSAADASGGIEPGISAEDAGATLSSGQPDLNDSS